MEILLQKFAVELEKTINIDLQYLKQLCSSDLDPASMQTGSPFQNAFYLA